MEYEEATPAPATPDAPAGFVRSVSTGALPEPQQITPEKRMSGPERVEAVVKRMRNRAMLPQQVFI